MDIYNPRTSDIAYHLVEELIYKRHSWLQNDVANQTAYDLRTALRRASTLAWSQTLDIRIENQLRRDMYVRR